MLKIQFRMIMAKHLIHFLTNLLMSYTFTEAKGNCDTGFCQTYPFDIYGDALQEKELVAHVFYNSVTPNPVQCYLWCIHDCRCLSFNYKEKKDASYCELNDASNFTHNSSLERSSGSRYYNLRRIYQRKVNNYTSMSWSFFTQTWKYPRTYSILRKYLFVKKLVT